jgi:hypothetical protein
MVTSVPSELRSSNAGAGWTIAAVGCVAGSLLVWFAAHQLDVIGLVDGRIVQGSTISLAGLVPAAALLLVGLARRARRERDQGPAAGPRAVLARLGRSMSPVVLIIVIGSVAAFLVLTRLVQGLAGTDYVVLAPVAPDGCRIVARETSFMSAADGSLYLVNGRWGIGHRMLSYAVDDGGHPFQHGFYRLTWSGPTGNLVLSTDHGARAKPNLAWVHCG